jgi:ribonuclease PH
MNVPTYAEGSVLISMGDTKVLCNATVVDEVPSFLKNKNKGWITAEYAMLPRSTRERSARESVKGKISGRTHEIQRLIGRSLRSVLIPEILGERQILVDCDVLQADGGTRTASINGAYVAVVEAFKKMQKQGLIKKNPFKEYLGAISVGMINGKMVLDMCYEQDSVADVDLNVVMTESGKFVEIQGTAEKIPFSKQNLKDLLDLAESGIKQVIKSQKKVLKY